ncbi:MAG: RagB/SusD family nutrient uptake outer membrane protein [Prevotellaceae bacterium]|jgi:hypothetical protein|nr:RagB/SusD family nutrient uptake outer membrane protein [Prevotellaceae bacterium]
MRHFFFAILLFAAACIASSCEKFLEVEPASKVSAANFFTSVAEAQLFALGAYSVLADDDLYGQKLNLIFTLDTDEGRYSTSTISDNSAVGLAHYNMTSSNTMLAATFNDLYAGVSRANEAIARIRAMPLLTEGTPTEQQQLRHILGEMMTLRAIFYFDLVKIWGDVPFVSAPTDYSLPAATYQLPRTSRDSIYDYIIADMLYVVDSLRIPWRSASNTPERFHQGAVRGLLARICLHAAGYSLRWDLAANSDLTLSKRANADRVRELYQVAHEQCSRVMSSGEHQLNPSFENIFKNYMTLTLDANYGESMYEVGFAFANNTGGGRIGAFNSGRQSEFCRWGRGNGSLLALPVHYILYEVGIPTESVSALDPRSHNLLDKRRDVTICTYLINDTNVFELRNSADYTAGKWRRHWMPSTAASSGDRTSVNWVMLRYADVLLMFAEAEYFLNGNTEAAREALNKVRRRGYGYDPDAQVATGNVDILALTDEPNTKPEDGICREIVRERTLELAHEGLRKYDLIRWGIYDEKLKAVRQAMSEMASQKDPYGRTMLNSGSNQEETALWPADLNFYKLGEDPGLLDIKLGRDESNERARKTFASFGDDKIRIIAIDFKKYKSELYPIAQTVLDANPQLKQCPAYE